MSNVKVKAAPPTSTLSIEYLILDIGKRRILGWMKYCVPTSSLGI
jgi:hypothetical protein